MRLETTLYLAHADAKQAFKDTQTTTLDKRTVTVRYHQLSIYRTTTIGDRRQAPRPYHATE